MIIVTGGAGFIGSNIIRALNQKSIQNILVVDNLTNGAKFANLSQLNILDYMDKGTFLEKIQNETLNDSNIEAVFHQGACSTTTEWNGQFMMKNNYEYSKVLLHYCLNRQIPFIYASSAAVYGNGNIFKEARIHEKPINVYGYSKFLFDQYIRQILPDISSQVVGLRYFNVYGPHEQHKGSMASVAFHFHQQLLKTGVVKLFAGSDGYEDGEQRRDFVFVEDVAAVNLWFYENPQHSGIFNVGTGKSQSFNEVAKAVIAWHQKGEIAYIPFPDHLKGHYQSYTQADISLLRAVYDKPFKTVEQGVQYLEQMS